MSVPALMTPVTIIGGKIFGWFTATESAAVAVLYAGPLSMLLVIGWPQLVLFIPSLISPEFLK